MHANLVIYSGGMDSFTVLHGVLNAELPLRVKTDLAPLDNYVKIAVDHAGQSSYVEAISFDYGQRHGIELQYAMQEMARLCVPHAVISLRNLQGILQGSALTSPDIAVPHGHYQAETMRKTVVPGRNTIMLSLAMAYAESLIMQGKADTASVWYGAHSGDHHIYPDCRAEYVKAMQETFRLATDGLVDLQVPYLHGDKEQILIDGLGWGLDYARSWTCYEGGLRPCGKCGSCQERAEAFAKIEMDDPLLNRKPL